MGTMITLPHDLADMTADQRKEAVEFYTGLKLTELRRRQALAYNGIELAYKKLQDTIDPHIRGRMSRAIRNQQIISDMLSEAVDKISFP